MQALLEVRHLTISFHTYRGLLEAIHDVSLTVNPGETVGIVGESGCGKSVTSQAAMKLLPAEATEYTSGKSLYFILCSLQMSVKPLILLYAGISCLTCEFI